MPGYQHAPSTWDNVKEAVNTVYGRHRKPDVEPPKEEEPSHEVSEPDKPADEITQLRETLQSEAQQASNAGKQSQSTDHANGY